MKPKTEDKSPQGADKEKAQGDSDQEMLNLNTEIYSLTHYADDEEELVAQMFATIKGSKLESMMPPILKEIPLIDVQQLCLHELRGMSQRRILSIINGQEMSGSSSDEDSEDEKKLKVQDENDDLNLGVKMAEEEALASGKDSLAELENVNESNLTALDILELEMRAKLIKTMLEKQEGEENTIGNGFVPDIKIKEEPLTPESTKVEEDDDQHSSGQRRKKYSHRRRSRSRSYSSSFSRSSSYSSRSSTRSRRRRSGSESRSGSSSDRKHDSSGSQESKKPTKKKITKREFEARMKKARMNRSYRKRKDSEEDSGGDKKKKGKSKKAKEPSAASPEGGEAQPLEEEENVAKENTELEDGKEGEVTEKEEGEIDSNEEGAVSSSGSRSRSRSYSSFSSYSSRSRSYSRSPRRRSSRRSRRKKSRKSRHRYRSGSSRSVSDGPKVPNWQQSVKNPLPAVSSPVVVTEKPTTDPSIKEETLPVKEDRQSVSFSFSKKTAPIKSNPELNDDGLPIASLSLSTQSRPDIQEREGSTSVGRSASPLDDVVPSQRTDDVPKENSTTSKPLEAMEDFYKGADQLDFSEEEPAEGEEEADLDNFLHNDSPVEPINVGEGSQKKSTKVVSNKDEPTTISWENKKKKEREKDNLMMEGGALMKTALSEVPSDSSCAAEEDNEGPKEESWPLESLSNAGEESSMDVVEPLPEMEDDSQGSHSLDIIGVIDPKDAEDQEELFNEGSSSWSMRWLQSEKVQKVVSNSKILSKMRKNIQAKGKAVAKEKPKVPVKISPPIESKPIVETPVKKIEVKPPQPKSGSSVIGSLEEYEKLFGIKVKAPTSLPQPKPAAKPSIPAGLLDSDEDEDSEEEALWSTIMKK